jgi:hypothetical protein
MIDEPAQATRSRQQHQHQQRPMQDDSKSKRSQFSLGMTVDEPDQSTATVSSNPKRRAMQEFGVYEPDRKRARSKRLHETSAHAELAEHYENAFKATRNAESSSAIRSIEDIARPLKEAYKMQEKDVDVQRLKAFQDFIIKNDWSEILLHDTDGNGDMRTFEEPQTSELVTACERAQNEILLSQSKLKDDPSLQQKVVDILNGAEGKCPDHYGPGFRTINPHLVNLIPFSELASEFSEDVIIVRQATIDAFEDF